MKDIRELSYGRMKLWSLPDEEPRSLEAPEDHCRNDEHTEDVTNRKVARIRDEDAPANTPAPRKTRNKDA